MATDKLVELEERLNNIQAMKEILEHTLECQCETMEECGAGVLKGFENRKGARHLSGS